MYKDDEFLHRMSFLIIILFHNNILSSFYADFNKVVILLHH